MAEALLKEKPANLNPTTAGTAGGPVPGGIAESADAESILTPDDLRIIGSTLNGTNWQADVAALIGCSRSQVTRYLKRSRVMHNLIARHLQYVIIERILQLVELLDMKGMPYAGQERLQQAISEVVAALAPFPGQEPPRDR